MRLLFFITFLNWIKSLLPSTKLRILKILIKTLIETAMNSHDLKINKHNIMTSIYEKFLHKVSTVMKMQPGHASGAS